MSEALSRVGDNLYVVGMGIGVVFVGLIAIIILCYIVGAFCRTGKKDNGGVAQAAAASEQTVVSEASLPIENRQEIIAAVSAAVAEDMGTDISAIRILSFKKI